MVNVTSPGRAFDMQRRPQPVEFVLGSADASVAWSRDPSGCGKSCEGLLHSVQALDIPVSEGSTADVHLAAAYFTGKNAAFTPGMQRFNLGIRINVLRADVERFAQGNVFTALVVANRFFQVDELGDRQCGPARLVGKEESQRRNYRVSNSGAAALETSAAVTFSIRSRCRKSQPPVPLRGPFAQLGAMLALLAASPISRCFGISCS